MIGRARKPQRRAEKAVRGVVAESGPRCGFGSLRKKREKFSGVRSPPIGIIISSFPRQQRECFMKNLLFASANVFLCWAVSAFADGLVFV
jgi:hypothetical protein